MSPISVVLVGGLTSGWDGQCSLYNCLERVFDSSVFDCGSCFRL